MGGAGADLPASSPHASSQAAPAGQGGMDELPGEAVVNIHLDMVRKTEGTSMDGDVPLTGRGASLGGSVTVDGRGGVSVSLIE